MWYDNYKKVKIEKAQPITDKNGVQHPANIFDKWTEAELNAIDIYSYVFGEKPDSKYYTYQVTENVATMPPQIVYTPVAKSVDSLKDAMIERIRNKAKDLLADATKKYSAAEMASWSTLEAEAKQYQLDGTIGALLQAEVTASGETVADLATTIITNATTLKAYRGHVVGTRTVKENQVNAMTTIEQVKAYENTTVQVPSMEDHNVMVNAIVDMCVHGW